MNRGGSTGRGPRIPDSFVSRTQGLKEAARKHEGSVCQEARIALNSAGATAVEGVWASI